MDNMNSNWCPWISCFNNEIDDPFHMYKDTVSLELEQQISKIANDLLAHSPKMNKKDSQNLAINLLMERLLVLQKEYTPQSQKKMVINLVTYLPDLEDFRADLIEQAKARTGFTYWFKNLFNAFKKPEA